MELGPILIPVLVLLSGAIALVGNIVGRNIGRGRLSLFGLRPRRTAQLVTIATGMVITVITLVVVLVVSREARLALFRLNDLIMETQRLESETQRLEAEIQKQQDRLKQLALGDLAYLNNQEVVREVIDGRQPPETIRKRVQAVVDRASALAREGGIGLDSNGISILLTPPNATWDVIADLIAQRGTETVLRLVANQNTLRGEPLTVFVQLFDNRRVYSIGTVLASEVVDGRQSREVIGRELLRLADQAGIRARGKVLPPPFTLITALPSTLVDIDEHRAAIAKVEHVHGPVRVQVVARRDVSTVGPLVTTFLVGGR